MYFLISKEMYLWLNNIHLLFGHYKLKTLIEIIKIKFQFHFEIFFKIDKYELKYVLLSQLVNYAFICLHTYIYIHNHAYIYMSINIYIY